VTAPATRPSLLLRVRDLHDGTAWAEFVELYAPLVHDYLRRRGLQDADAADVVQEVLGALSRAMPGFRYDPGKGTFRGWLFTVVRRKLDDFLAWRQREVRARGDATMHRLVEGLSERDEEDDWDRSWRLRAFAWAAERVRRDVRDLTWRAFYETAVRSRPAGEVASELAMSVGAVYVARSRVLARLRACVGSVDPEPPRE
jgi:RNA polymerase sigma-70 factor (ECF subfamily)